MNPILPKRVTFHKHVTVFEYENEKENNLSDFTYCLMDWERQEPRHISPQQYMTSVQNLLEDVCRRQPMTIVYGNLGRYPKLIQYYIDVIYPMDELIAIRIGTNHVDDPIDEVEVEEFKSLIENYADDKIPECDVLFWIEPRWGATVQRPRRARRLIVLTSHLQLEIPDTENSQIVAHHVGDMFDVQRNAKIPPLKKYVRSPNEKDDYEYSFVPDLFLNKHIEILGGRGWTYCGNVRKNSDYSYKKVCADLTKCDNVWEVYLRLLTARDIIRYSSSSHKLKNWNVAIGEGLKNSLLMNLTENKNIISTKYARIPCNLNGVNVMVEQYIDPFLV